MNAKFAKVLALVLMLALVLSGCNLIEIDAKMQADEDIAKINKAYSKVVATYDGGEITAGDVMGNFNTLYNDMAYTYYYYLGYEMPDEEITLLANDAIESRVRAAITAAKFDEGHSLTEEEIAAVEEEVQLNYDSYIAEALEYVKGDNAQQKQEYARVFAREYGVDYETLYANSITDAKTARMEEILRGEVTGVTEEELQAAFDEAVEMQKEYYTDGSSLENAMTGEDELVCWLPEGYRTVKHILVMPGEEAAMAYSDAAAALDAARNDLELLDEEMLSATDDMLSADERNAEEVQTEIDAIHESMADLEFALESAAAACLADVQDTLDEIYARLAAGEDFEALIAEYGEDPGMQMEPTMSRGYYVSDASETWEANFRDAAMALENVGDYTAEPVISGSGVHIIQYVSDVPAGEVDIETVREELTARVLEDAQATHSEETITGWVEALNPNYDVEAFRSVIDGE